MWSQLATILNKRNIIRACFDHFDIDAVAAYGESDVERIMRPEGCLSTVLKLKLLSIMLLLLKRIQSEFGSFCNYIWGYKS